MRTAFSLAAMVFAFSAPLQADTINPNLPAAYAVTGVASDDTLNLRAAPSARSAKRGELSHNDTWVEVIEFSREGLWALVNTGETSGWASTKFLAPQPMPRDEMGLPRTLACFGNEPFWSVRFAPSVFMLSTPDRRTSAALTFVSPGAEAVDLPVTGLLFEWGAPGSSVQGHILPGRCSDGMSDRVYGLHYVDPVLGHGCCSIDE